MRGRARARAGVQLMLCIQTCNDPRSTTSGDPRAAATDFAAELDTRLEAWPLTTTSHAKWKPTPIWTAEMKNITSRGTKMWTNDTAIAKKMPWIRRMDHVQLLDNRPRARRREQWKQDEHDIHTDATP